MKTATITWITYNNYGTELQAYALQYFLTSIGIENRIISDADFIKKVKSGNITSQFMPSVIHSESAVAKLNRRIKKYMRNPAQLLRTVWSICESKRLERIHFAYIHSQKLFQEFKSTYLDIDYEYNCKNIDSINTQYDAFICGSDQIWSVFDVNFNGYFYLDFAKKKKLSYASSLGTDDICEDKKQKIIEWLKDFDAVSVREHSTANILSTLTGKPVHWVCDPTLLLDNTFWEKQCGKIHVSDNKYILCYFLSNKSWYFDYAESFSKFAGLKLVLIPSCEEYTKNRACYKKGVGPCEFIALIKNASFVLTDSYHGSIFSLLFEKNFLCFKRFDDNAENNQNIRIFSLFEKLDILKNIIYEKEFDKDDIALINYINVNIRLKEFREESKKYLIDALLS